MSEWQTTFLTFVGMPNCDSGEVEMVRLSAITRIYLHSKGDRSVVELETGAKLTTPGTPKEIMDRLRDRA